MTTTWYRTQPGKWDITTVLVERATEKCIWVRNGGGPNGLHRQNRVSEYDQVHETWHQARDHLFARAADQVLSLRERANAVEREITKMSRWTPPADVPVPEGEVFLDPSSDRTEVEYRVRWRGQVCRPTWRERGPALAYLDAVVRGVRKAEVYP